MSAPRRSPLLPALGGTPPQVADSIRILETNPPSLSPIGAPVMTFSDEGRYGWSVRATDALDSYGVYNSIYPTGLSFYDGLQGVVEVLSTATILQANAVAGYIRTVADAAGGKTNAVAVFGCGVAAANGAAVWGFNTLIQDSDTRAVGALTGITLTGYENDINVMCPGTSVNGYTAGGNSLSQPTNANAYTANVLGVGIKWIASFNSQDAAATYAFNAGMKALSGASVDSQYLLFQYTDSGSVKHNIAANAQGGGYLVFDGSVAPLGYVFKQADIFLDAGHGLRVNGNVVASARKTGWTLPTGTLSRAAFDASTVSAAVAYQTLAALVTDIYGSGAIGA